MFVSLISHLLRSFLSSRHTLSQSETQKNLLSFSGRTLQGREDDRQPIWGMERGTQKRLIERREREEKEKFTGTVGG
jgi:hypothetical protein